MRKLAILAAFVLLGSAFTFAENIKITTSLSASVDKFGDNERPGVLLKFELPAELEGARIDLALLRFKVQIDTARKSAGFLVRPLRTSWTSGARLTILSDSAASPGHVDFGRVNFKKGTGELEITRTVQAWTGKEASNFGLLIHPADRQAPLFQLQGWPGGGVAELEIFYTPPEVTKNE